MMAKQEQKTVNRTRKKNGCRGIHHSIHSPHLELEFCKKCDAHVQALDGNICSCCKKPLVKLLKNTWLSRVLKFGVRQHHNFLRDWMLYPDFCTVEPLKKPYTWHQIKVDPKTGKPVIDPKTNKPVTIPIRVTEGFVKKPRNSQILEVRYRDTVYVIPAKYLALALEPLPEDVKLKMIKKHVKIKGFRIWLPDEEQTDVKCPRCSSYLRYDKNEKVRCPKCDV